MTNDPDQMRANIEATRGDLSRNVDALTESVRPGNVARRQKDKVNSAVSGAKDAVMGHAGSVQSTGSDALQATGDAISSAPDKVQQSAQGNPLAAGLIAVGVGWLVGSLLPASRPERQAAATLKDKAAPLAQQVSNVAKDTAQNLQQPAKEALGRSSPPPPTPWAPSTPRPARQPPTSLTPPAKAPKLSKITRRADWVGRQTILPGSTDRAGYPTRTAVAAVGPSTSRAFS